LLIFFDGSTYLGPVPGPVILDNFTARKRLPPVVAVFVGNVDGPTRVRELSHNEAFEEFLARELVPWAKRTYRVTSRPSQTAVIGSSIGATAAAFSALRHPELFGNVLSQSGGYQMAQAPRDDFGPRAPGQVFEDDFPEYEWIARQYAAQARTAVKFYLEIGLREEAGWKFVVAPFAQPGAVGAHRHLRDVLRARGYEVHYNEFNGGHDALCWRGSVADGLVALIGTRHGSR
jgi:enterochelin esterase family protein